MAIIPRFLSVPHGSSFLFGPRGTGKTTWLRDQLPNALYLNLLRPDLYRELAARPERLRELVLGNISSSHVIVDEVQRAPELLNVVHDLIETPGTPPFVLTGSSARKLRRGGVDLLAGRAVVRTLHPFLAAEFPEFQLQKALHTGLVPLVVTAADPEDTLRSYAAVYVEQEIRAEGLVRNVGNFSRFLEAVSFSHAAVLSVSNVARESAVSRKTVEGFLEILDDLLLAFRIPVFTRRARRMVASHPKFYLFDAGVYRSLRPSGPLDRAEEIDGAALEGLVAQHLRAWIAYSSSDLKLHYWRTRSGVEVDFVLYGSEGLWCVQVQNSGAVRSSDLRSLKAFREDYAECSPLLLYRGQNHLKIDGIHCAPVDWFLRNLRPGSALPIKW